MHKYFLIYIVWAVIALSSLNAGWVVVDGQPLLKENAPYLVPQEHFAKGQEAFYNGSWATAAEHMQILANTFPETSFGQDAFFYLAVSHYHLGELDLANSELNDYLNSQTNPIYFEEAIEYKFYIAEQYRAGQRRRLFGTKTLPKWASGKENALEIYDEVLGAMPNHELAVKALFYKGCLLWEQRDYQGSIDSFQALVRRFPKHELAPDSFLYMNKVYLEQSEKEFHNPDLMAFAELNLNRFEAAFPREERLEEARADLMRIKERYARGLYDTGQFYERVGQPRAAVIYYQKAYRDFSNTQIAVKCRARLHRLYPKALDLTDPAILEEFPETDAVLDLGNEPLQEGSAS